MDQQPDVDHEAIPAEDAEAPPESAPRERPPRPYATYSLIAISVFVYVRMATIQGEPFTLFGLFPAAEFDARGIVSLANSETPQRWWHPITATFVHSGLYHLFSNVLFLWLNGRSVERLLGKSSTVLIYLVSISAGDLLFLVQGYGPFGFGASGAVTAFAGAGVALLIRQYRDLPKWTRRQLYFLPLLTFALYDPLWVAEKMNPGHLGGYLAGFACGWILIPHFRAASRFRRRMRVGFIAGTAMASFAAIALLRPIFPSTWILAGEALHRGDYEESVSLYGEYIQNYPNRALGYHWRGSAYFWSGKHDAAIEDYNRAIEQDPDWPAPLLERGYSYSLQREFELALSDLSRAIELDPTQTRAFSLRAFVQAELGNDLLAIGDYTNVLNLDPDQIEDLVRRGRLYTNRANDLV